MAAEFVTLTDFYTGKLVAVRPEYVCVVAQIGTSVHLEIVGDVDLVVVQGPFAAVVARLNGEDQTDGR
jgi:hypothetical protein